MPNELSHRMPRLTDCPAQLLAVATDMIGTLAEIARDPEADTREQIAAASAAGGLALRAVSSSIEIDEFRRDQRHRASLRLGAAGRYASDPPEPFSDVEHQEAISVLTEQAAAVGLSVEVSDDV